FAKNRRKVEHCDRPSRRRFQSQLSWADLYAPRGGETSDLSSFNFYRLLCPWTFLAHVSRLVQPDNTLNVTQSVPYRFRDFLNVARVGRGRLVRLGQSRRRRAGLSRRRGCCLRLRACAHRLRRLVLSKDETTSDHHMKKVF